jgi:Calx-beta domain/SprB repeat/CHU_C Type IX secretion signal domain
MRISTIGKAWLSTTFLFCSIFSIALAQNTSLILAQSNQRHSISPQGSQQSIELTGLQVGQTYRIFIPPVPALAGCLPEITINGQSGTNTLSFMATAKKMPILLTYPCAWQNAPTHFISTNCISCAPVLNTPAPQAEAPLTIENISPEEAIRDVLIGGDCFDVTNIEFTGAAVQLAQFGNGITNVGFNTGVLISTGDASTAIGPNDADNAGSGVGGGNSDADLGALTTQSMFDVAKLEFDFRPTQTPVVFEYVFASEEYCEFVNAGYNDIFGFFISGPGIPGGTANIATIPATTTPVAIDNVNHLLNSGFYVNNQTSSSSSLCGQAASVLPSTNELQFDGYTRKFIATANVIPCQTYHIKLAIADLGDPIFDSGVFLKAGSFDAGGNASVNWVVDGDATVNETYEDCGTVKLMFSRVGGNLNVPLPVQYTISGTATSGTDYAPITQTVVIPAGQSNIMIPVTIFQDLIIEGQENIVVTLNNLCSCSMPQEILVINDLPPLSTQPDTLVTCSLSEVALEAFYQGGVEPVEFFWSNAGGTDQTAYFNVAVSTTFRVTITDACGKSVVQPIRVNVNPTPRAQLFPPAPQLCPNGSGTINVTIFSNNFAGNAPYILEYSINGVLQPPIFNVTTTPYPITVTQPGTYQIVSITDAAGCEGPGLGSLLVTTSNLGLSGVPQPPQCAGNSNGSINTTVTGGSAPYTYTWSGPTTIPNNTADPINLVGGTYTVMVSDAAGCSVTAPFTLALANPLSPSIVGVNPPNCTNPNGGSINLEVTGGTPGYTYVWSNSSTLQDPQNLSVGTYTVTVTDLSGCAVTATASVVSNQVAPVAVAGSIGQLSCLVPTVQLTAQGSSVGNNITYQWAAVTGTLSGSATAFNTTANQQGVYQLSVTNTDNGCVQTDTVLVQGNQGLPFAEAGPPGIVTCAVNQITLNGTGSSAGNNQFIYNWSASNGGTILGGSNTLQPSVVGAGSYTLTVTDLNNGCSSTDVVQVTENKTPPVANAGSAGQLNCTQATLVLNGTGSSPSNVNYNWNTTTGLFISGQNSANPIIGAPGTYQLIVTNPSNGCTDDASVVVTINQEAPIVALIANPAITCVVNAVPIVTTANTSSGPNFNYVWTATNGGVIQGSTSGNSITATAAGNYTLVVTNTSNNCTAASSVNVTENVLPPVVVAGPPATLNCFNPTVVVGDPNTFVLPFVTYQWTASGGGVVSGNGNLPSLTVSEPGVYTLSVTNTQNGCTNVASVNIGENQSPPQVNIATPNQLNCTNNFVQLNGNGSSIGPTFSYQWTTTNGVISTGANTLMPVVTSDGNYQLVVTNSINGCTSSGSVTVIANLGVPAVVIAQAQPITCVVETRQLNAAGTSTGPNFNYQWGTVNGQIISGANSLTPTVGEPGTYTLVVTNTTNNCTAVQNVVVPGDITPPVINAGPGQTLNCNTTSLTLSGTAPSNNHNYQWTATNGGNIISGSNTLSPVIDEPGTYVLTVVNNGNGCTAVSSVQIQQDAGQPIAVIAPPATLTCTLTQTQINASASSSNGNFAYSWTGSGVVSGGNTLTPTVNAGGIYELIILNNTNGCTTTATVNVPQNNQPPVADAGPNAILNCSTPALQINGANMSTGANFTYNWTGPGIVSGNANFNPVINQPGNYAVTVTNVTNGCTAADQVLINADFDVPNADAGPGTELTCVDNFYQTVPTASMGAQFVYNWTTNGGSFLNSPQQLAPIVNGSGFYYLLVTNTTNGCTATSSLQVTLSSEFPLASAGPDQLLTCSIEQVSLDGTNSSQFGEITYFWTPVVGGNIVSGQNTLTPVVDAPGLYSLAVTNTGNGCISYSTVEVEEDIVAPNIDAGPAQTLTCTISSLNLEGDVNSNGNFTYAWTASNGGNILAGANTLSPTINAVGTYNLVVSSVANGCTAADQVTILADQNLPVAVVAEPDTLTCINTTIILSTTGSTAGPNIDYIWQTSNGNIIDVSDSSNVVVNLPGVYQLVVRNNTNNCQNVTSVQVFQNKIKPLADAGADSLLNCNSIILTLNGEGSSQNGNYFYAWTTPNGEFVTGEFGLTPTISAAGTYLLTVLNTDNGCSDEDVTVIAADTELPDAVIVTPAVISCFSSEVVLDGSTSSNGNNFTYAWTTPNGNILSGNNDAQAVVNAPGSYTLTVLNNLNGCANANTTVVTENTTTPDVQILPPDELNCSVEEVLITALAENGSQYAFGWTTFNGNIIGGANTLNLRVNEPGTYAILIVNNLNGCAAIEQTLVTEVTNVPESFEFTVSPPDCNDNNASIEFDTIIGGIGPYLYSIDNGDNFFSIETFNGLLPGNYDLIIQDIYGCELNDEVVIPAIPDPGINLDPNFNLTLGDSLQLNASLLSNYPIELIDTVIWEPMDYLEFDGTSIADLLKPTTKPLRTIRYQVTIISKDGGCEASDRVLVQVDTEPLIYIPNVFWPEDPDNSNSVFLIFAEDELKQIRQVNVLRVFDRWGNQVHQANNFQPNDPGFGWNGRMGTTGEAMNPAVFVYYAEIEMIDGRVLFYEGDVTLIR